MNIVEKIQTWYSSQCDGDWEHEYGVNIFTIDNPGWGVSFDLEGTTLSGLKIPDQENENNESDWFSIRIRDNVLHGTGDQLKLDFLLNKLMEILELHGTPT
jgi:hypothetical protein